MRSAVALDADFLIVLVAGPADRVRAASFEVIEIAVADIFGDDDDRG